MSQNTGAQVGSEIDTAHTDMIHDAQMDYHGKRLATCSSDRTVKIFDVEEGVSEEKYTLVKELRGHEGPVWQVAWAHPSFGSLLASCSHDKKVFVYRENDAGWEKIKSFSHLSSVNSVAWGPQSVDKPLLASASSDGTVQVHEMMNSPDDWSSKSIDAHAGGVMSVSWAPSITQRSLVQGADRIKLRFATCGCDNLIKIWEKDQSGNWNQAHVLQGHTHWVRDVAWTPNSGIANAMIASCSQDGTVLIWEEGERWNSKPLWSADRAKHTGTVWRVSWSLTGSILAVSTSDNKVTLWKQSLTEDTWDCVSELSQPNV
eukprot:m.94970 g.94970  ORF g.94970 m.94970 type:complete len:316 (+) comp13471_c0_seq1:102-1049(+)